MNMSMCIEIMLILESLEQSYLIYLSWKVFGCFIPALFSQKCFIIPFMPKQLFERLATAENNISK